MTTRSRIFYVTMFGLAFLLLAVPSADAYVDPGSGSFVFQVLVGAALAGGLAVKAFWHRIVSFVSRRDRDDRDTADV